MGTTDRSAVLIDLGYLRKPLEKEFGRADVDLERFADAVCRGSARFRTYVYDCPPWTGRPPTADETARQQRAEAFHRRLTLLTRFELRLGRLERRRCSSCGAERFQQKRVDILLSIDLVRLATRATVQEVVLVAGDSDFIPAVTIAKEEGVLVRLFHGGPTSPPHADLLAAADERVRIDAALIDSVRR